ncbi:MAG: hypothetical protein ACM359_21490 [Bacillota bacterium]
MRFSTMIAIVGFSAVACAAHAKPIRPLLDAICEVETKGGLITRDGNHGQAKGPYQIKREYWKDAGVRGRYLQVRDKKYAEKVMLSYWKKYAPQALKHGDYQTLARIHNGGPTGHKKASTAKYWSRVRKHL